MKNRTGICYITANYLKQRFKTATNIHRVIFIRFTPILVSYSYDVTPNFTNIAAGTSWWNAHITTCGDTILFIRLACSEVNMVVGHTDYPPNKLYKQDVLIQAFSTTRKMKRTVCMDFFFFWKLVEGPCYIVGSLLSKKGISELYLKN